MSGRFGEGRRKEGHACSKKTMGLSCLQGNRWAPGAKIRIYGLGASPCRSPISPEIRSAAAVGDIYFFPRPCFRENQEGLFFTCASGFFAFLAEWQKKVVANKGTNSTVRTQIGRTFPSNSAATEYYMQALSRNCFNVSRCQKVLVFCRHLKNPQKRSCKVIFLLLSSLRSTAWSSSLSSCLASCSYRRRRGKRTQEPPLLVSFQATTATTITIYSRGRRDNK